MVRTRIYGYRSHIPMRLSGLRHDLGESYAETRNICSRGEGSVEAVQVGRYVDDSYEYLCDLVCVGL